jgi:hypothetical protein
VEWGATPNHTIYHFADLGGAYKEESHPWKHGKKNRKWLCLGEIKTKDFGMRRSEPTSYYYYT